MCQIAPTWTLTIDNELGKKFSCCLLTATRFSCVDIVRKKAETMPPLFQIMLLAQAWIQRKKKKTLLDIDMSSLHFNDLTSDWDFFFFFFKTSFFSLRRNSKSFRVICLAYEWNHVKSSNSYRPRVLSSSFMSVREIYELLMSGHIWNEQ